MINTMPERMLVIILYSLFSFVGSVFFLAAFGFERAANTISIVATAMITKKTVIITLLLFKTKNGITDKI